MSVMFNRCLLDPLIWERDVNRAWDNVDAGGGGQSKLV